MSQVSVPYSKSDLFLTSQERARVFGPAPVKVRSYTITPAVLARFEAQRQRNADRDAEIVKAHRELHSIRKTAAVFGLSFQRVHAIVARGR